MTFDLKSYLGVWYEIGRNNAWFEIGCETAAAVYTLENNQMIINNYCYERNVCSTNGAPFIMHLGSRRMIKGVAAPTYNPLVFDITFETGQNGKYNILFTDYVNYAIVGDSTTGYLSILSRQYGATDREKSLLTKIVRDYGFNQVEWTV